ncbi:MAG: bifunctional 4-hydroxy-2-oxoglutarate aldolase/2-dehydro-3-deoxy-phosphogluconate aldolase [Erythrobacter sp.]
MPALPSYDAISSLLERAPIVPLVGDDDPDRATATARALGEGGLGTVEVVMRSPGALASMKAILAGTEGLLVGAGTVLTLEQAREVVEAGAQFVVSPGLVEDIVRYCQDEGVVCLPGTMTAGEVQRAHAMGLRAVKFFPASLAGGVPMLKAFGAVFSGMRFMPTGGIDAGNLHEYLALPHVLACGGSWLTPKDAVAQGDYAALTKLAREALSIAKDTREAN